jgi:hypothetical protein
LKLDPCLSACTCVNSKWIKDFNIRPKTLKLGQERTENTLETIDIGKDFLSRTQVAQELRGLTNGTTWNWKAAQQKKWSLNWRGHPQNGRKIFASYTPDKGLITRLYKELKNLNFPQPNQWPKSQMGKWTEQNFFKGRSPNG